MTRDELQDRFEQEHPGFSRFDSSGNSLGKYVGWLESLILSKEWVSVKTPPKEYKNTGFSDDVLLYLDDDFCIGYYRFKQKDWYSEDVESIVLVSHWHELPPPPIKKEK